MVNFETPTVQKTEYREYALLNEGTRAGKYWIFIRLRMIRCCRIKETLVRARACVFTRKSEWSKKRCFLSGARSNGLSRLRYFKRRLLEARNEKSKGINAFFPRCRSVTLRVYISIIHIVIWHRSLFVWKTIPVIECNGNRITILKWSINLYILSEMQWHRPSAAFHHNITAKVLFITCAVYLTVCYIFCLFKGLLHTLFI